MAFDADLFMGTDFERRTHEVALPELAAFFDKSDDPVFVVQMLDSNDLHAAENALPAGEAVQALMRQLASGANATKAQAVAELLGIAPADDIEPTLKKQLEMVRRGLVSPALDLRTLVKLSEQFPTQFRLLYQEIIRLTGLGAEAQVKPPPSGSVTTSESP